MRILLILLPMLAAGCAGDSTSVTAAPGDPDPYGGSVDSSRLIGLGPSQVTGMLGPADFRRDDGPAQILQYRSPSCVLDLYLYRDNGSGEYSVRYVDARDRSLGQVAPQTCLASVVRSRRTGQASS